MKIDLIASDGSPMGITPPDIEGRGVGGAELAMMTLMRTFAERGHNVRVFNNPRAPGRYDGVTYHRHEDFQLAEPRDVIILFRAPSPMVDSRAPCRVMWWSCDQYTVGDYKALSNSVNNVICISDHHRNYFLEHYQMDKNKIAVFDLGVRLADYNFIEEKVKNRLIFCSVPDRGLEQLLPAYKIIKEMVPDATLTITSDYRLWGAAPMNERHRLAWAGQPGVTFYGMVPRRELIRLQTQAEILAYPCTYDELFCIAIAECQVAGALPVTSAYGALPATNSAGIVIPGQPDSGDFTRAFASRISGLLTTDRQYMKSHVKKMQEAARRRFDWSIVAQKWERLIKEGKADA